MIKVEYLLPFDTKEGTCKDIESFKSLITSNSNFKFKNQKIGFKGTLYNFEISLNKVDNKNTSVFHIIFSINKVSNKFREMLKSFRKIVGVFLKDNILLIWDGISFEWFKDLYPRIYNIENSLRKLISKFMLINLGIGWHKSSVPKDVKDSIKQENYHLSQNILYEVDFIQLANFLFKPYSIKEPQNLPDILSDIIENGMDEDKKNEILDFLPKNNWDRYFSELVEIESEQLNKKWKKLYEIRNKVAHNKSIVLEEYETAKKLCEELDTIINKAIKNIDKIKIPEKDIESIGLKTMGTINEFTDLISSKYLTIDNELNKYIDFKNKDLNSNLDILLNNDYLNISDDLNKYFTKINELKNDILSGSTINYLSNDDLNMILSINIDDIIPNLNNDKQSLKSRDDGNEKDKSGNENDDDNNKDEEDEENENDKK